MVNFLIPTYSVECFLRCIVGSFERFIKIYMFCHHDERRKSQIFFFNCGVVCKIHHEHMSLNKVTNKKPE